MKSKTINENLTRSYKEKKLLNGGWIWELIDDKLIPGIEYNLNAVVVVEDGATHFKCIQISEKNG